MNKADFRFDIQGLRGLAILSVVIFHLSPSLLPGGFIGVDIFFVISGYLIIGQIWRAIQNHSFELLDFYSKRIRRLFPALFAMLCATTIIAYQLLLPKEFSNYIDSLISALLYVSNFWFYTKSGYFNSELENALLLHTWSLSVEEQFYILAPLILLIFKRRNWHVLSFLIPLVLVGLLLSELFIYFDESFSFYASPSRFWQFAVGGLLAIKFNQPPTHKLTREILVSFGLLVLVGCFFMLDESNFPGAKAALPTFATAVVIYAGKAKDLSYYLLANPVAKFYGDISYSLYLWHWPLIILFKLTTSQALTGEYQIILLAVSTVLGYLSYCFIEQPTRRLTFKANSFKPLALASVASISLLGCMYILSTMHYAKFQHTQLNYESYLAYPADEYRKGSCFLTSEFNDIAYFDKTNCITAQAGKTNILLIGDSHASHWYAALRAKLNPKVSLSQVTASGCKPVLQTQGESQCTQLINWAYQDLIKQAQFDKVIISARWASFDNELLKKTILYLKPYVKDIIVFGPIIEYKRDLPRLLATSKNLTELMSFAEYERIKIIDAEIESAVLNSGAQYRSVLDQACTKAEYCATVIDSVPLQFDYGHLTLTGASYLLKGIKI
ncbi:acyltransferase [Catenovulum sp. 2E275]|uniref:acyltransferase family protein n=1 Tax=Catenovulum sp. 2E275 TaxID=2980497 RepID=UPI0021D05BB1|nr:acyltransferase family protein [Catenovulum sp. 2E275]MCU4677379.1 acyltransferase [Catenovulum sp. 2E275]